jgi:4-amino-4-deoxy-L-arabinose transferase-like glycosyltransferase
MSLTVHNSLTTPSAPTPERQRWIRPGLIVLLVGTAVLYLWGLGASGWANSFYSAAVQAGTKSWQAFFFGSSDASNFITVDKTPAALWPMELFARVFGVNSWSILIPQALEGVAAVALLYATVVRAVDGGVVNGRALPRNAGPVAGLLAGAVLALTPVAALMFRFNNPDALLVLLLTAAAYGAVRAQLSGRTGWLLLAGGCVGFGFLAKMFQAFLVVPVFAVVYLVTAPVPVRRRIVQLLAGGLAMVVAAGWWVAVVAAVPASDRPYIGGSQHNSVLELAFGYNGFGRLTGDETGGLGNLNQDAGWSRLFGAEMGGQIAWLLPAALILLAAGLWITRRFPRTDPVRAALALWGGWLLVTGVVFSFAQGIIHPYYTVALAPAIGALVGMGAVVAWRAHRWMLAVAVAATAWWAYVLLDRTASWYPSLRYVVLIGGLVAAGLLLGSVYRARMAMAAGIVGVAASIAGPAAYAVQTAATTHNGAIPSAGPATGFGPGGFGGPRGGRGGFGQGRPPGAFGQGRGPGTGGLGQGGQPGGFTPAGRPGTGGVQGGNRLGGAQRGPGGIGGLLDGSTPSAQLTSLLKSGSGSFTWVAATVGSNNAAGYQLATGRPVMAIGGFNGTDPAPTLAQFQRYVAEKKIHYFVGGGVGGGAQGTATTSDAAQQIAIWVEQNFKATTVGTTTIYNLT